jgi:hypothetical protein
MFKNKIIKILFRSIIVIAILNLSGFSFADDACSDNAGAAGLPTILADVDSSEDLPTKLTILSSSQTIAPNGSVELRVEIDGLVGKPYSWSVSGNGYSLEVHENNKFVTLTSAGGT